MCRPSRTSFPRGASSDPRVGEAAPGHVVFKSFLWPGNRSRLVFPHLILVYVQALEEKLPERSFQRPVVPIIPAHGRVTLGPKEIPASRWYFCSVPHFASIQDFGKHLSEGEDFLSSSGREVGDVCTCSNLLQVNLHDLCGDPLPPPSH